MKKTYCVASIILVLSVLFSVTACGGATATSSSAPNQAASAAPAASVAPPASTAQADAQTPAAEVTVIKLGTTVNEQDSFQIAAEKFGELVKERTGGAYEIEIYPNGALGDERTMLEGMQMGTLDMGIITSGPFVNFVPEMGVLDMPFMFGSNEEAYTILDGDIGQSLLTQLETANLKGLAYAERGFRNLTNSVRPVNSAADIEGLKLRVMENEGGYRGAQAPRDGKRSIHSYF